MKLLSFKAEKVYEYLNFDISFNGDLSFLIGGNGAGKTTAIKLIQAILTPKFKDLFYIPFERLVLIIQNNEEEIHIDVTKDENYLEITTNKTSDQLILNRLDDDEIMDFSYSKKDEEEFFDSLIRKNKESRVLEFILQLDIPIFLGLEREHTSTNQNDIYLYNKRLMYNSKNIKQRRFLSRKYSHINGTLSSSLIAVEVLIKEIYEKISRDEDRLRERLRNQIISSSFYYTDFNEYIDEEGNFKVPSASEKEHILKRRSEIEMALENIGTKSNKFSNDIDSFFNKIDKLIEETKKRKPDEPGIAVEWITNLAQINRIGKLVELIDKNKAKIDDSFKLIHTFINSVNHFFEDSGKEIEVNNIGELKVNKPNGKSSYIDALSSGERQLLVLFAQLIFNNEENSSNIFIIDEPELSLHLKWQDEFVSFATKLSPNTQLILATHSPEIFAGYEDKTILMSR